MNLPSNSIDLLAEFGAHGVDYLLIGGQALALHGHPRFTKDADIWLRETPDNLDRAKAALRAFGAPLFTVAGLDAAQGLDVVCARASATSSRAARRTELDPSPSGLGAGEGVESRLASVDERRKAHAFQRLLWVFR